MAFTRHDLNLFRHSNSAISTHTFSQWVFILCPTISKCMEKSSSPYRGVAVVVSDRVDHQAWLKPHKFENDWWVLKMSEGVKGVTSFFNPLEPQDSKCFSIVHHDCLVWRLVVIDTSVQARIDQDNPERISNRLIEGQVAVSNEAVQAKMSQDFSVLTRAKIP